jgi:hypothetical protein
MQGAKNGFSVCAWEGYAAGIPPGFFRAFSLERIN